MEFFLKHQTVIARSLGAFMLVIGFVAYFWITPQKGVSENAIAAANVARMEARVTGSSSATSKATKSNDSKIAEKFKETREDQVKYLMIIMMITGVGFLGYSFIKKDNNEKRED